MTQDRSSGRASLNYNPHLNPMSEVEHQTDVSIQALRRRWLDSADEPFQSGGLRVALTEKCNFGCPFCYNEGSAGITRTISADDLDFFLDCAGPCVKTIKLTGGEPLLHREFDRIARLCSDRAPTTVTTNGSKLLQHLPAISRLTGVTVSILSLDEQSYQQAMGTKTSVRSLMREIATAMARTRVPFQVNTVISADTAMGLVDLFEQFRDADFSKVNLIGLLKLAETDRSAYFPYSRLLCALEEAFGKPEVATSTRMRFLGTSRCPIDVVYQYCTVGCDVCRSDGFLRLGADLSLSYCLASRPISVAAKVKARDSSAVRAALKSAIDQMGHPSGLAATVERPRRRTRQ